MTLYRVSFIFGVLGMLIVSSVTMARAESGFSDVPVTHPNYKAITYLKEHGYISGYEDGTFLPDRILTRAELVKIALLGAGIQPKKDFKINFTDVPEDAWFAPYVAEARDRGIVSGYDDGTFRPDQTVTRVEGLKILLNTKGVTLRQKSIPPFQDVPSDSWYAPYVQYIVDHQLLKISGPVFDTNGGLKRQDVAQILYTMILAEQAATLTTFPLLIVILWILVWIASGALGVIILQRDNYGILKKIGLWVWSIIVGGPLLLLTVLGLRIRKPTRTSDEKREDDDAFFHPDSESLKTSITRRHVYLKRPRKIGREILVWVDYNMKPLFYIIVTLGVVWILWSTLQISLNTMEYQQTFTPITDQ